MTIELAKERVKEFFERNAKFAKRHDPYPPLAGMRQVANKDPVGSFAIVSCADPRIIPEEFFDFTRPEVCVIRNAGGRVTDDVFRSLQVMDAVTEVGIGIVMVVHHTDCGGLALTNEEVRQKLHKRNPGEAEKIPHSRDFGVFSHIGLDESIRHDVALLKSHPFLRKDVYILGCAFDIETGLVREVL